MKIINTAEMTTFPPSETEKLWIYNGLDCCITAEVLDALLPQLDNQTRATYEFSKALQAPCLEMKLRGVKVDQIARAEAIEALQTKSDRVERNLNEILREGLGIGINWRSPVQTKQLFYDILRLPPVKKRGQITTDRDALERLSTYFFAEPLVNHILFLRDVNKKIGVLKTEIDPDGRIRTSYNIAGTTTGRLSSSFSDFGTGTNLQNIEQQLRKIFVADKGMKFAYVDLEQAESRLVGAIEWNLFHDGKYLDACESGDLHTTVCKLAWADLPWMGDLKADREVAERPFYRQHSYRHMAKVLGHGTNYNGQPYTMAKHTKLDKSIISEFQTKYFAAFPAHRQWHGHVRSAVARDGNLTTLTGRRRWFFGRRNDDATVREAIAFDPQGSVGDILNRGMLSVWRANICQLLLQVHDAILVQYPEEQEDAIVPQVLKFIEVPVELSHGRTLIIPSEAKTGWNWSDWSETNPDGLMKYRGKDDRKRSPQASILDRKFL